MRLPNSAKIKELRGYAKDWFDDLVATIEELTKNHSLPQLLGVGLIVVAVILVMIVAWAILSLLLGLLVWGLWHVVAPPLGIPMLGYWQCYCLTLLCSILFRGHTVKLDL